MELPPFVTEKLEKIAERLKTDIAIVQAEYEEFFKDPFVQKDPQFTSDEQRHRWASGAFWNRNMSRRPVSPMTLIPIGVDAIKKNKTSGYPQTSLFVLDTKGKLRRMSLTGDVCFKTKQINFFHMYKDVKVSEFKDSGDLGADDRTVFENPIPIDMSPVDIIEQLGIEKVPLNDVQNHLSAKDSTGYANKKDWKCVHGFVGFSKQVSYEEGEYGESGRILVSSGDDENVSVSADGDVLSSQLNCWASPTLQNYPKESECYFLGTLTEGKRKTKDGREENTISMNCYCIVPIIVTRAG
jgi:hypothetical protein